MATNKVRLGKALKDADGSLHGKISGLGIGSTDFVSEPATSLDGNPYYKLIADPNGDAYEVGAAFPKEKDGMKYYSVSFDSPIFPAPVNAALFPDKNSANAFNLVWNRPEAKQAAEATAEAVQQQADNQATQQKRGFFRRGPAVTPQ